MKSTWCSIILLLLGALFIGFGVIMLTFIPQKVLATISTDMHLGFDENGTYNTMTKRWIQPKYSMTLKVWIFSITNADDVINHGKYPVFAEKGPYTFIEHQQKVRVHFMENNTRVLYRNKRMYTFDRNASCRHCNLDDTVTFPNVIYQVLLDAILKLPAITRTFVLKLIDRLGVEKPFITATVDEMLFSGYEDALISALCNNSLMKQICSDRSISLKVHLLENNTDDGEYLIDTGLEGSFKIGKVYRWNGLNETLWWRTPGARMLNGTDAGLFPPDLPRYHMLRIFLGELSRSVYLNFKRTDTVNGISTYRYAIPADVYDPFRVENKGFCHANTPRFFNKSIQPDDCLPAGLFDIGYSKPGAPRIYLSGAHFYNSPSILYQHFTNFTAPTNDDETYFNLEPNTGAIVSVSASSQINIGMISGNLTALKNMHNMIVPVLWINENVLFDDETKNDLAKMTKTIQTVLAVGTVIMTVGILFWMAFIALSLANFCSKKSGEDEEHLIGSDTSTDGVDNEAE